MENYYDQKLDAESDICISIALFFLDLVMRQLDETNICVSITLLLCALIICRLLRKE